MASLDDPARLAALERLDLLDAKPGAGFDRYTKLAAEMLDAPVALVSLVEPDRQLFLSCHASEEPFKSLEETPLSHSFCKHSVAACAPLVISDAREEPLVSDNPAIGDFDVIAYAGAPIVTRDDQALGTLCVMDHEPRDWTPEQVGMLTDLAGAVATEIETRARMRR
jgi:GAF domain-containing protein